jgi:acetyl esterase
MHISLRQRLRIREGHLRARYIDGWVHAFAKVRYAMPDARPSRYAIELTPNLVYGPSDAGHHRLDVYVPTNAERPLPVVMYVHGGGFGMLSKDTHRVMAMAIARRGYLVFNINYRQGVYWQYPAPLEDATTALLWVHRNAHRFGGDPDRIAIAGESAGGNLVTALALASSHRHPEEPFAHRLYDANVPLRCVISTYPFLDMRGAHVYLKHPKLAPWLKWLVFDAAVSYVGERVYQHDHHNLASPLVLLENGWRPERPLPPFFLSVGTRDPLLRDSKRLKAVLDRLGVESELVIAPGEIHGYDAMVWRRAAKEKWLRAHAFLTKHMQP